MVFNLLSIDVILFLVECNVDRVSSEGDLIILKLVYLEVKWINGFCDLFGLIEVGVEKEKGMLIL